MSSSKRKVLEINMQRRVRARREDSDELEASPSPSTGNEGDRVTNEDQDDGDDQDSVSVFATASRGCTNFQPRSLSPIPALAPRRMLHRAPSPYPSAPWQKHKQALAERPVASPLLTKNRADTAPLRSRGRTMKSWNAKPDVKTTVPSAAPASMHQPKCQAKRLFLENVKSCQSSGAKRETRDLSQSAGLLWTRASSSARIPS